MVTKFSVGYPQEKEFALALLASSSARPILSCPLAPPGPRIHESTAPPPTESLCAHGGWHPPSPALGLPIGVSGHGHHLLLACDFGVLEDAVPHHTRGPDLLAAAEKVGYGVHTALDVSASQEAGAVAAHPVQSPQDQVGLPEKEDETVRKNEAQIKG